MRTKQMDLFREPVTKIQTRTYADFSIHEKINFKANQCGLHDVLKGFWQYYTAIRPQAKTDMLSERYWWHHRTNSGSDVRIDYYRKSKQNQLSAF